MSTSILAFFLTARALAAAPADALAAITEAKHVCESEIPALDKVLDANPADVGARIDRGVCRYRVGRYDQAVEDLDQALGGVDPEGVPPDARDALVVHVVVLAWSERLDAARTARKRYDKVLSDPARARADVAVTAAGGNRGQAWKDVDRMIERWPHEPHTQWAAAEMASHDPRGITTAAGRVLSREADANTAYNKAVLHLNVDDGRACLDELDPVIPGLAPEAREPLLQLAYSCAVLSGDLARADSIVTELGSTSRLRASAVVRHGDLLRSASRDDAALTLLRTLPDDTPDRDTVMLGVLRDKGDLDGALAVALHERAAAPGRANLALELKNAGRVADAVSVLEGTCPDMSGEGAARCYDLLNRLKGEKP